MKLIYTVILIFVISSISSGCSWVCSLCTDTLRNTVKVSPGPPIIFSGQVLSNFGEPVSGAIVHANGQTATSDKNGNFQLPAFLAWRYLVTIEKDGYGLFSGSFTRGVSNITWTLTKATVWENQNPNTQIDVKDKLSIEGCQGSKPRVFDARKSRMYEYRTRTPELRKAFAAAAYAISQPTECSPGIRLTIPAGTLEYEDGNSLSGSDKVTVSVATVDLFSRNGLPGDFTFIRRSEGRITQTGFLESFGAGSITVKANGRSLRLKSGSAATLVIPVDPNQLKRTTPPQTIPLLVFDESQGVWVHEGTATLDSVKNEYVAQVTHFSEYNADVEFNQPACVKFNATAIGQNFDLWQRVLDDTGMNYHPKPHFDLIPGTHAVWALPPVDNPPLNQGLAQPRTGHQVILTAYEKNSCLTEGNPSCKLIDQVVIPGSPAFDLVKQTGVVPGDWNSVIPDPPDYTQCQEQVTLFKDPTQIANPIVTATPGAIGGITVSWISAWDSAITVDNQDGFEVEEAVCAMTNVVTTPTLRCGAIDTSWSSWSTPQSGGVTVVRAKTAKDGNAGTNRTTQMDTAIFPRLPGLYKYRVRAYYHQSALADPGNPNAGYTDWSDDSVLPATQPNYWASIGAGRLQIINNLTYVAPGTTAQYQDTWVSRLRISDNPQNMMSGQLLYGYTPERLQIDNYCGGYGDSLWDVPPNGALKPPSIMTFGWDEPNNLNGNIMLPLSNYYLYIGLGHWYLWNGYGPSTMGTGATCSGMPTAFAKHVGGYNNFSIPYYHRSVGGKIPVPGLPPGTTVSAGSNYLAVQDHFTGTLTIRIGGTPRAPTVTVLDQNNNPITTTPATLNIVGSGLATDPVNSRISP